MMNENREAGTRVENAGTVSCPSCGTTLIAGLRFCRMCGYRLGEGVEEYVATQRLDPNAPRVAAPSAATDPFAARATWGPLQPNNTASLGQQPDAYPSSRFRLSACRPRRGNWMIWMVLMIVLTGSGALPFTFKTTGDGGGHPPKSFVGVDGFDTAEGGGARVQGIAGPNTPFVNAGLIGGDIITSFDGKQVADGDALRKILADTPPGKTVEVTYIRDGVMGKTSLTTMSEKDFQRMSAFDNRPGGEGNIEISTRRLDRVFVPSLNIYGVKVNSIDRNGPADISGMKEGDIVIKFGDNLIRTPGDLRYRIDEAVPGSVVDVLVVRGAEQLEIPLKIGRSKN